jgi:hypothetical protein
MPCEAQDTGDEFSQELEFSSTNKTTAHRNLMNAIPRAETANKNENENKLRSLANKFKYRS